MNKSLAAPAASIVFTDEEIAFGVKLLGKMGEQWRATGLVPKPLYYAHCEASTTVAVEIIPYRENPRTHWPEILLIRRPSDDPYYTGYHIPGKTLVTGRTIAQTLALVRGDELGQTAGLAEARLLFTHETKMGTAVGQNRRGDEIKFVHAAYLHGTSKEGEWFRFGELPKDVIPEHVPVLERALPLIAAILQED